MRLPQVLAGGCGGLIFAAALAGAVITLSISNLQRPRPAPRLSDVLWQPDDPGDNYARTKLQMYAACPLGTDRTKPFGASTGLSCREERAAVVSELKTCESIAPTSDGLTVWMDIEFGDHVPPLAFAWGTDSSGELRVGYGEWVYAIKDRETMLTALYNLANCAGVEWIDVPGRPIGIPEGQQ